MNADWKIFDSRKDADDACRELRDEGYRKVSPQQKLSRRTFKVEPISAGPNRHGYQVSWHY